ncbi:Replicative DNA helicase (DnaB) [hydrothermal vent metagenome]|uniref:Replicative DNA helicase (DnaB) n=1 Tax=hydrothermal vent metagenome TaxID=652676 RepID=A0A1W1BRL3_9ZZZZ
MNSQNKKRFTLYVKPSTQEKLSILAKEQNVSVASLYTSATEKLLKESTDYYNDEFYNLNIERALLSAIIFEPSILKDISIKIKADDLYLPFHQKVFSAMIDLDTEDKPIDEEFLKTKLNRLENFDEIAWLDILASNPISNTDAYIDDLLERSNRRKLNLAILRYRRDLYETSENSFKIKSDLVKQLENLEDNRKSIVKPMSILDIEEEKIFFYTENWLPIPKNAITIIGGSGGASKSALVLQLLMRIIKENPNLKIFGWLSEDLKGYTKERFSGFKNSFFKNEDIELFRKLEISGSGDMPFFILNVSYQGITVNEKWYQFKEEMRNYDIIVLDPLIAFFGGEENSNTHARFFMNLLNEWVAKENKTLILIHHSKKPNGKDTRDDITVRGAGAIVDASRLTYEVKSTSIEDYKSDYKFFTGVRYNSLLPTNIDEKGSDGYTLAMDAIMTHRRILIAKDNLGVKLLMSKKCNLKQIFYIKAWGEKEQYEVVNEN